MDNVSPSRFYYMILHQTVQLVWIPCKEILNCIIYVNACSEYKSYFRKSCLFQWSLCCKLWLNTRFKLRICNHDLYVFKVHINRYTLLLTFQFGSTGQIGVSDFADPDFGLSVCVPWSECFLLLKYWLFPARALLSASGMAMSNLQCISFLHHSSCPFLSCVFFWSRPPSSTPTC